MIVREDRSEAVGADDVAGEAAEVMLGPNLFIGLRQEDLLGTVAQICSHAVSQPDLLLKQAAALLRDLISVLSGNGAIAPPQGDKRFTDLAWKDNPFYLASGD